MSLQEQINQDIKTALLAGDKTKAETLKGLKNAFQYEAVANRSEDRSLDDEQVQKVLARESKKRSEAAELYKQGGNQERADSELSEKTVIDSYLPEKLDEATILTAVKQEVAKLDNPTPADMGKTIGLLKARLGASADGATIARLVKEQLGQAQ